MVSSVHQMWVKSRGQYGDYVVVLEHFTIIGVCALLENERGGGDGAD